MREDHRNALRRDLYTFVDKHYTLFSLLTTQTGSYWQLTEQLDQYTIHVKLHIDLSKEIQHLLTGQHQIKHRHNAQLQLSLLIGITII